MLSPLAPAPLGGAQEPETKKEERRLPASQGPSQQGVPEPPAGASSGAHLWGPSPHGVQATGLAQGPKFG